jgi:GT2 family glycosyltransferase
VTIDVPGGEEGASEPARVPVSVVVPTIGRPEQLGRLLESLARCSPLPEEIVVVDQSREEKVARVAGRFAGLGVRMVPCDREGFSLAWNVGLREARHDSILGVDDDCTVGADWVSRAWEHARRHPGAVVTGQVLPRGDPSATPSTKSDPEPHDYTGELRCNVLYTGNMVLDRRAALEFGGFDERLPKAADNDFCYRWLRAGNELRYEPDMVVWHEDWRTPDELRELYVHYARAQGMFYAKHLRRGDLRVLRFVVADLWAGLAGLTAGTLLRRGWTNWRRGILLGLPAGLAAGWRVFGARHPGVDPRSG